MKTRLLGGIAALLVAIIGTVLLVSYVQNADKRALAGTETETIYVVQKAIPAGASAERSRSSVIKKSVPKVAVAENNVTDLATLGSKVAAVALMPGEQLLSTRMVEAERPSSARPRVQVPAGLQEITLKLPIERVAGGKLKAGDTVGVFLSLEQATDAKSGAKASKTQLSFPQGPGDRGAVQQRQRPRRPANPRTPRREPARCPRHRAARPRPTKLPHHHGQELCRRGTDRLRRGVRQGLPVQGAGRRSRSRSTAYVDTARLFR